MGSWINTTDSLRKGIELINGLDGSKFPLLLNRIAQSLQQNSSNQKPFSDAELEKLESSLILDKEELKCLLDSVTLIIENAAYHLTKPASLKEQLVGPLKLNSDKADVFVSVWSSSAKGIVEALRQRSVFPSQLEDISWTLNLQSASSAQNKQKIPKAVVQFALNSDVGGKPVPEKLTFEFNHEELYEFYKKIETIQSQLDSLR